MHLAVDWRLEWACDSIGQVAVHQSLFVFAVGLVVETLHRLANQEHRARRVCILCEGTGCGAKGVGFDVESIERVASVYCPEFMVKKG